VTPSAVRLASGDAVPSDGGVLRPIRRGVVEDWDALESVYHHIFYEQARHKHARTHARAGAR
jgi:actin-related protein